MESVAVTVEMTENNYSAYTETLPGCVTTGKSMDELKDNMYDAVEAHIELSREHGDKTPVAFDGEYRLVFRFDSESLLTHYKGIFTNSALERMTGINQRQLQRKRRFFRVLSILAWMIFRRFQPDFLPSPSVLLRPYCLFYQMSY